MADRDGRGYYRTVASEDGFVLTVKGDALFFIPGSMLMNAMPLSDLPMPKGSLSERMEALDQRAADWPDPSEPSGDVVLRQVYVCDCPGKAYWGKDHRAWERRMSEKAGTCLVGPDGRVIPDGRPAGWSAEHCRECKQLIRVREDKRVSGGYNGGKVEEGPK